ncbi:sigma-70 family RNA polymerase sigma factor [Mucilaginibacter sp.]|uniref:RNA polymerase sigma factor n=1 Tax=Mucilaginibacter sp. TaxID=1882438 RepID=UPI0032653891
MLNETDFLQITRKHEGILHKICRLYRDSPEDREDLFQEIIYQLWKAYPSFKGQAEISTWIYRIALNTAMAFYRKKRPAINYVDVLPDFANQSQDDQATERLELLYKAIKQLNDVEKAIITLYLDELPYQQIAVITGITENNVGVRINRIKTKMQQFLNQ